MAESGLVRRQFPFDGEHGHGNGTVKFAGTVPVTVAAMVFPKVGDALEAPFGDEILLDDREIVEHIVVAERVGIEQEPKAHDDHGQRPKAGRFGKGNCLLGLRGEAGFGLFFFDDIFKAFEYLANVENWFI